MLLPKATSVPLPSLSQFAQPAPAATLRRYRHSKVINSYVQCKYYQEVFVSILYFENYLSRVLAEFYIRPLPESVVANHE